MDFRRFLGLPERPAREGGPTGMDRATDRGADQSAARTARAAAQSDSIRRLVGRLESLPPDRARFHACYAYTLARAANADMVVSDVERELMQRLVTEDGGLRAEQAAFVVELAAAQAGAVGGTEDFLVTREFFGVSTPDERRALVRACLAVAAADGSITADESAVVDQIGNELGLSSVEVAGLRSEYHDRMAAIQALRRRIEAGTG